MPGASPNPYGNRSPQQVEAETKPTKYLATAYCGDFGPHSINGGGVTAGGTDLRDGKPHYVVAAGVGSGLSIGDEIRIDPDPYGGGNVWKVDDHGGMIVGKHIDLYVSDCKLARAWGRKQVTVTKNSKQFGGNTAATGDTTPALPNPAAPLVSVANAIGDLASIAEKFVEGLFNSATWFRVGKVLIGVFIGLFGLVIIARPLMNQLPPSVKTAAEAAALA